MQEKKRESRRLTRVKIKSIRASNLLEGKHILSESRKIDLHQGRITFPMMETSYHTLVLASLFDVVKTLNLINLTSEKKKKID